MKNIFELVIRLARGKAALTVSIAGLVTAASAQGGGYTIQIGQGTSPFMDDPPPSNYTVDPTGIQNNQGVHGFVTHHNGSDTYVNMPGENYYITFLHINTLGQVSGTYNANYGGYGCTSFFWSNGQLTLIPSTANTSDPHVSDMNDLGAVVGNIEYYGSREGFILDHGSVSTFSLSPYVSTFDYNGTIYHLNGAFATINGINDLGQLSGGFSLQGGPSFWYIASPIGMIPEPGTVTLLGLGALVLVRLRKKV